MMTIDAKRPLVRPSGRGMLAGVCAGLADWLGWDVTLVRIAYVAVSICSAAFPGLIAYLILWVLMPKH